MSKVKPSLPKGTRDFLPNEVMQRKYIFNTIRNVLEHYGFSEIETPAFERLETLTGKYGEEGDRLLFKILNSGDFLSKVSDEIYQEKNSNKLLKEISEKGLRYDLTVPLARYVVQHQGDLVFPFKRYHVAPVWRADRPQRGRYQEFYQFDADIISADSLINDVELTQIYAEVFTKLRLKVLININNRKFLDGLAYLCLAEDYFNDFTTILDKEDKIGSIGVRDELNNHPELGKRFSGNKYFDFMDSITKKSNIDSLFNEIDLLLKNELGEVSIKGQQGIIELKYLLNKVFRLNNEYIDLKFTPTLARGITYYTGTIWEVTLNKSKIENQNIQMGSIGGGGRYDNLTEMFGGQNMSGIGISFGVERIYDVMQELNLFSSKINKGVKVLVVARDEKLIDTCYDIVLKMREAKIACEFFTGNVKKQKQMPYAIAKNIEYIMEIGEDEITNNIYRIKNIESREEQKLSLTEIIENLK